MCCEQPTTLTMSGYPTPPAFLHATSPPESHAKLVSIMEHGLQLRQEINTIREQFRGILDSPAAASMASSPCRTRRAPRKSRTPLQTLDKQQLMASANRTPTTTRPRVSGRGQRPRMGCEAARSKPPQPALPEPQHSQSTVQPLNLQQPPPNALISLQNYLKTRKSCTPTRPIAKRKASEGHEEQLSNKVARLSASDSPSTWSRKSSSMRRLSIGSKDSLKKILLSPSKRRNAKSIRTVHRSPILTNGILIRNKEGELLNPPSQSSRHKTPKRRILMDPPLPKTPCPLGLRTSGDGAPDHEIPNNNTVELSHYNYTQSPPTFYVRDALQERMTDSDSIKSSPTLRQNQLVNGCIQTAIKAVIPDRTYLSQLDKTSANESEKTMGDKTIGDISMISKAAELTMRDQPSALVDLPGAEVLHSTLNYPLHSTMVLEAIDPLSPNCDDKNQNNQSCDSSTMSFCVDDMPFDTPKPASSADCDVCKHLRRQTGQGKLQHIRKPIALSESDFLFDQTVMETSLNATRGSIAQASDITNMTCSHMENTIVAVDSPSSMEQTTVQDQTLRAILQSNTSCKSQRLNHSSMRNRSHRRRSHQTSQCKDTDSDKENSRSTLKNRSSIKETPTSSTRLAPVGETNEESLSSASSSMVINPEKKRELRKKMKKFNNSMNSNERSMDIKTLGFF